MFRYSLIVPMLCATFGVNCSCYRVRYPQQTESASILSRIASKCKIDEYQCKSQECISEDLVCDGKVDCLDNSDETSCSYFPCPSYAFKCTYGACISPDMVCNGIQDCRDNSDENVYRCGGAKATNVKGNCSRLQFACKSGECIDDTTLCDGQQDCADISDETVEICSLLRCPEYAFRCDYGACINGDLLCDDTRHCFDGSDEKRCEPMSGKIAPSRKCSYKEFRCASGECIDDFDLCDGVANCRDGSDETPRTCGLIHCPLYAFQCDYGACINAHLRCDSRRDCVDGSDERNCTTKQTTRGEDVYNELPTYDSPIPDKTKLCLIPKDIPNGRNIVARGDILTNAQGNFTKLSTLMRFKCSNGYVLYPANATSICHNGWSILPQCLRTCSPIHSTHSMNVACALNDVHVSCAEPMQGTVAKMSCAAGYQDPAIVVPGVERYRICYEGSWDNPLLTCTPAGVR